MARTTLETPDDDDVDALDGGEDSSETAGTDDDGDGDDGDGDDNILEATFDEDQYIKETGTVERLTDALINTISEFADQEEEGDRPFSAYDKVGAIAALQRHIDHEFNASLDVEDDDGVDGSDDDDAPGDVDADDD